MPSVVCLDDFGDGDIAGLQQRQNVVFDKLFGGTIAANRVVYHQRHLRRTAISVRGSPAEAAEDEPVVLDIGECWLIRVMLAHCSKSFSHRALSSMAPSAPVLRSFNLALIQLGQIGSDKAKNIIHAREQVLKAASRGDGPKPQLIVLPVGVAISVAFRQNAEIYWRTTTGVFQFPLWCHSFPRICGDNRVQARRVL
jgi:hypothetical protein